MLVCVDGTGPSDSRRYYENFSMSFVNRIKNSCTHSDRLYHRGPGDGLTDGVVSTLGGTNQVSPSYVFGEILQRWNRLGREQTNLPSMAFFRRSRTQPWLEDPRYIALEEQKKIFLSGYSRGGATVIDVANLLKRHGMDVEAMFLFDAVDRSSELAGGPIPDNVKICYHAIRDPRGESRESFGNCGIRCTRTGGLELRRFLTTHGGMGGVPSGPSGIAGGGIGVIDEGFPDWRTALSPSTEAEGMRRVEAWMWQHLRNERVL